MALFGCRGVTELRALLHALLMTCGACATQAPEPASSSARDGSGGTPLAERTFEVEHPGAQVALSPAATFDPGVELPEGDGRELVVAQCLVCHQLSALELFKDFYTRASWRSLVISMRAYGANLDDDEAELVSAYLARHFGIGELGAPVTIQVE